MDTCHCILVRTHRRLNTKMKPQGSHLPQLTMTSHGRFIICKEHTSSVEGVRLALVGSGSMQTIFASSSQFSHGCETLNKYF